MSAPNPAANRYAPRSGGRPPPCAAAMTSAIPSATAVPSSASTTAGGTRSSAEATSISVWARPGPRPRSEAYAGGAPERPDVAVSDRVAHRARLLASGGVETLKNLHWPLVLGLGALALVRPLIRGVTDPGGPSDAPAVAITVTLLISVVWIAVVGWTNVAHPVLTLVCAGLVYGAASILLSAILSPLLTGELQGPLA